MARRPNRWRAGADLPPQHGSRQAGGEDLPKPVQPALCAVAPSPAEAAAIRLIRHGPLVLRLRWRLEALRQLFDQHSFWACHRRPRQLARMLGQSQAVVSAWRGQELVGFGRATSDGVFRAVLWDVVVATEHQGLGLGRRIVEELLLCSAVRQAERVYLMTTNSAGFYRRLGFDASHSQHLLVWHRDHRQAPH
ncbi:GNAT family N-acetyltransferase [Synechococcus sp. CS-1328]|uniref:GNAT family N-acetyltransferase n=1 Tax=Synechococcus sp. CS-1328 TaxID=2847976 RepID=UPI00223A987B|nr:GNAT family N-acetyltransferase [Synechococcus sp. CS-1328]MCT0224985.1 GNAT family N-acetyltransferase [Synechococcus sp. CS-1328]